MASPDPPADGSLRERATSGLLRVARGETAARDELFQVLYADLHAQATRLHNGERADHTLQPTALLHEAWMRLIDIDQVEVNDKAHFLALAARAMRHILVEHARTKSRSKRGGNWKRINLDGQVQGDGEGADGLDLVAVDRALERLRERKPRLAEMVELRFFGGLEREDVARILCVSNATVGRDWLAAKALLSQLLAEEAPRT